MKLGILCYVRNKGKALLISHEEKEHYHHKDKWNGLGGKIEPGETPEECCIREVEEESGIKVKNPVLKGLLTFHNGWSGDHWYVFLFTTKQFEGEPKSQPGTVLRWVDEGEALKMNIREGDKIFMKWFDKPGFFSAKFVYNEKQELIDHKVTWH